MRILLFKISDFFSRLLTRAADVAVRLTRSLAPADIQNRMVVASTAYHMVTVPDETYYAEQYCQIMFPYLEQLPKNAKVLDLGCSQGRFTIPVARKFPHGKVVACDLSEKAISQARDYASQESVTNIEFSVESVTDCLLSREKDSFDAILMTEVTFFYPEWMQDLPRIVETLKSGGLLLMSFRSQYYNALHAIQTRMWETGEFILQQRKGPLQKSSFPIFTWQTSEEIKRTLIDRFGLRLLDLRGIGVCSGIPGDPLHHISRPSQLNPEEKKRLMKLELELGKTVPDAGRYMFAVAQKNGNLV